MEAKKCTKCWEVKVLDCFSKSKSGKNGLRQSCRACDSEYKKDYRLNNAEKVKLYNQLWKKNNPDKVSDSNKRRYEKYPEVFNEACKKWRKNNPDAAILSTSNWRKNHLDRFKGTMAGYRERLPDAEIRHRLKANGIPITPETIALKRKQLTLVRTIKNLENETN